MRRSEIIEPFKSGPFYTCIRKCLGPKLSTLQEVDFLHAGKELCVGQELLTLPKVNLLHADMDICEGKKL